MKKKTAQDPFLEALAIAKDFLGDGESYHLLKVAVDGFIANRAAELVINRIKDQLTADFLSLALKENMFGYRPKIEVLDQVLLEIGGIKK